MVADIKLYSVLEVPTDLDPPVLAEQVAEQFRRLAPRYHPNSETNPARVRGGEAPGRFRELCWALKVLQDPEMRRAYDAHGAGRESSPGFEPLDVFSEFFGGRPRRGRVKPPDTVHELATSLEDFFNGRVVKLSVTRSRICPACDGRGTKDEGVSTQCRDCGAGGRRGVVRQLARGFIQQVQVTCTTCGGRGVVIRPDDRCLRCAGSGVVRDKYDFEVRIEPGMRAGQHFTKQGEGDQEPGADLPGDIIIVLSEKRHDRFRRKGDHLLMSHELSLAEALCGFALVVEHLDSRQLCVQPPRGQVVNPNQFWQVVGEGMPMRGCPLGERQRGHLLIQFTVTFPQRVTEREAEGLSRLLGGRVQALISPGSVECWLRAADDGVLHANSSRHGRNSSAAELFDPTRTAVCAHQ